MFSKIRMNFIAKCLTRRTLTSQTSERSLNQIQLIGRVGQDPRVSGSNKDNADLKKVVLFSVATNEYLGVSKDTGDAQSRTDWHRVCVFKPRLQENVERYLKQGDRVHVQGRIHYNLVKDNSGERYITSIIADDVMFLSKTDRQDDF